MARLNFRDVIREFDRCKTVDELKEHLQPYKGRADLTDRQKDAIMSFFYKRRDAILYKGWGTTRVKRKGNGYVTKL